MNSIDFSSVLTNICIDINFIEKQIFFTKISSLGLKKKTKISPVFSYQRLIISSALTDVLETLVYFLSIYLFLSIMRKWSPSSLWELKSNISFFSGWGGWGDDGEKRGMFVLCVCPPHVVFCLCDLLVLNYNKAFQRWTARVWHTQ